MSERNPESFPDNWSDTERELMRTFNSLEPGDEVLFANRSIPLQVERVVEQEGGRQEVTVEGQRGGVYTIRERYDSQGRPRLTSDAGRATNLQVTARADETDEKVHDEPPDASLTETQYEELVDDLTERAVDAYMRMDYETVTGAVDDVVEEWLDDVAFHRWNDHQIAYHDDAPEQIFSSVMEQAGEFPEPNTQYTEVTPRNQAELVLQEEVLERAKPQAEKTLVTNQQDYDDLVEKLAHLSIDRYEQKSYPSARVAVRDTISNYIDRHGETVHEAIIQYGEPPSGSQIDHYQGEEDPVRERAYDTLDIEVWDRVSEIQRQRGDHDPTKRGLTAQGYEDLVEALVEQTLRRHHDNVFLRTTANDVVEDWADEVEQADWDGHRFNVWAAGDADDIFASAALHARDDPVSFNPFSNKSKRQMAIQVLTAEVYDRAENAVDRNQEPDPVPATEYLQNQLGLDIEYDDIMRDGYDEGEVAEYLAEAAQTLNGDEVGWTFVDELMWANGQVPQSTNEWILLDYGLIRSGDQKRQAAWFHRETGDVLVLQGAVEEPTTRETDEATFQPKSFSVALARYREDDGLTYLMRDEDVNEALEFVYDYVGARDANLHIYENEDGEHSILDAVDEENIDTAGSASALVPNMSIPTKSFTSSDLYSVSEEKILGAGKYTRRWATELKRFGVFAALTATPYLGKHLSDIKIQPDIHKRHGVGIKASYVYGNDADSKYNGKVDASFRIKPTVLRDAANDLFEKTGVDERLPDEKIERGQRRLATPFWNMTNWVRGRLWPLSQGEMMPDWDELPQWMRDEYDSVGDAMMNEGLDDDEVLAIAQTYDEGRQPSWTKFTKFRFELIRRRMNYDDLIETDRGQARFWEQMPDTPHGGPGMTSNELADRNRPRSWLQEFLFAYAPKLSGFVGGTRRMLRDQSQDEFEEAFGDLQDARDEQARTHYQSVADAAQIDVEELIEEDVEDDGFRWTDATPSDRYREARESLESGDGDVEIGAEIFDEMFPTSGDAEDIDFDSLDRADPGLSRLFLRGADMEYVASQADNLDLSSLKFRIPFVSDDPRDPPSFQEWRENRYGYTMDGPTPDEVEQWADYQKDLANLRDPPNVDEETGAEVPPEELRDWDFETADDQGDYYQGTYFAEEYGTEFNEVAEDMADEAEESDTDVTYEDRFEQRADATYRGPDESFDPAEDEGES